MLFSFFKNSKKRKKKKKKIAFLNLFDALYILGIV